MLDEELELESEEFEPSEYWQFNASSVEGLFILKKLGESIDPKPGPEEQHAVLASVGDNLVIYMLKKKFYTPAMLAKALGVTPEAIEAHSGIIELKVAPTPHLPEPTVNYWGEA